MRNLTPTSKCLQRICPPGSSISNEEFPPGISSAPRESIRPLNVSLLHVHGFTDMKIALLRLLTVGLLFPLATLAQITINGVADKSTYNNTVTFTVVTQPGYDYNATLNWMPIATGVPVIVNEPDFYELRVD